MLWRKMHKRDRYCLEVNKCGRFVDRSDVENQRVRLSKKMLKDALLSLLQEKPLSKISVLEICETAQINRTTFYKYYGSQLDLLGDIESDFLSQMDDQIALVTSESPNAVVAVLESLYDQRCVFRTLVKAVPGQEFASHFFALPSISSVFESLAKVDGLSKQHEEYIREFICQGTFAVLCDWLGKESPEPVWEIAEVLGVLKNKIVG